MRRARIRRKMEARADIECDDAVAQDAAENILSAPREKSPKVARWDRRRSCVILPRMSINSSWN